MIHTYLLTYTLVFYLVSDVCISITKHAKADLFISEILLHMLLLSNTEVFVNIMGKVFAKIDKRKN